MPNIPSPLYALVGATDAAAQQARAIPAKVSELSSNRSQRMAFNPRSIELPKVDLAKLELPKIDFRRANPRNLNLRDVELPKVDMAAVAGGALEFAAKAERTYEDFVTRGADVVERVTGNGTDVEAPATPVATPESVKPSAKTTTKPTAKPAPKTTRQTTAETKADSPTDNPTDSPTDNRGKPTA